MAGRDVVGFAERIGVPHGHKSAIHSLRQLNGAIDLGEDRHSTRLSSLEEFFNPRQAARDVQRTGNSTRVERTHGQLRARLANALRGDDAGGFSEQHLLAVGQRCAVAALAQTSRRLT